MRKLVVDFSPDCVSLVMNAPSIMEIKEKLEYFEMLTCLRDTPEELTMICKIKPKDGNLKAQDVFSYSAFNLQPLESDEGVYTCFFRYKRNLAHPRNNIRVSSGYLCSPFEFKDGHLKVGFIGTAKEVRELLRAFKSIAGNYRVVSLSDAKFSSPSPLAHLTEKQHKVLTLAHDRGYYEIPKKVSSQELAKELGISCPTFVRHRRKAERRLLNALLSE